MSRQMLDDGRWFDPTKAEKFEEDTWFNGHNRVSHATGDQWEHETLYRTAGGIWIVYHWSQRQGSRDSCTEVTNEEAARWLVANKHDAHEACAEEVAALEVK